MADGRLHGCPGPLHCRCVPCAGGDDLLLLATAGHSPSNSTAGFNIDFDTLCASAARGSNTPGGTGSLHMPLSRATTGGQGGSHHLPLSRANTGGQAGSLPAGTAGGGGPRGLTYIDEEAHEGLEELSFLLPKMASGQQQQQQQRNPAPRIAGHGAQVGRHSPQCVVPVTSRCGGLDCWVPGLQHTCLPRHSRRAPAAQHT